MSFSETIFLTGFPGFIAEKLVARLAQPETRFFLLVQPQFVEKARLEVEKIAAQTAAPLENFAVIEGDITEKNLGISESDLEIVRRQTTDVFHLAAIYDLAVERNSAFKVNVEGTANVNEFVESVENLRRYNYVSTCYVAGKRTGEIFETELFHDAGFRNYYEETKYLAELEVEKLKAELPVTIYRPSVVVGDSKTGETVKYDGIYYLLLYLRKAPALFRYVNVGNKRVRVNLVPVDFVVEGIAALSKDETAIGATVALADPNPLTTEEIFDAMAETLTGKKSLIKPPTAIIENSLLMSVSPALTGLPHSSVPYFFLSQTYDTKIADKLLGAHQIACPNFRDYVGAMVDYVKKHPRESKS